MKTAQVLDRHLAAKGLSRSDAWLYILIGGLRIPYLPRAPFNHFLTVHDIHHVITGYSTGIRDEIYLIAWELASGGWGRHTWWYFGKTIHVLLAFLHSPVGCWDALRTGFRQRNLYSFELDELLDTEYDIVLSFVENGALSPSRDRFAGSSRF